jgi:hypothetical protein
MNIELLKKEVLQTICEYIEASQPNNLNIDYCINNNIHAGLCAYSNYNKLHYLADCIYKFSYNRCHYMYTTPHQVKYKKIYELIEKRELNIKDCHNARLKYLIKIFTEILYIERMKQEGKIYTYYLLIDLFKF